MNTYDAKTVTSQINDQTPCSQQLNEKLTKRLAIIYEDIAMQLLRLNDNSNHKQTQQAWDIRIGVQQSNELTFQ